MAGGSALPAPARADPLAVAAAQLPLNPDDPAQTRLGPFVWRGTLHLTAADPRFGGFSDLRLEADGRLTAVSDRGYWLTARLVLDEAGRLAGLEGAEIDRLRGLDGAPLARLADRDAESLVLLPGGDALVGFERAHRIWRYPAASGGIRGPAQPFPAPPGLAQAPPNEGLEGLALLADGRLLALSEGLGHPQGGLVAWISRGPATAPTGWQTLAYRPGIWFQPTAAAGLPDGGALVLERRFSLLGGLQGRLVRLPAAALASERVAAGADGGAVLPGMELARLQPPLAYDNMEGLALLPLPAPAGGERLRLLLISDDNYRRSIQRTLLMMFETEGPLP